ncbi:MAG: MBL fold metallo-hydrolase [Spartobacteria bacterium]|nr:MBL fold metallo-hydrolase [Spartobacteria bacterium]
MYTLKHLITGPFEENCYLISHKASRTMLIIDPGADAEDIMDAVAEKKATVTGYLLTHGHADHIGALHSCWQKHPAPIYLHPEDQAWAFTAQNAIPPFYPAPLKAAYTFLTPKDNQLEIGHFTFSLMHTPGHTPGGVIFLFDEGQTAFTGDTLFRGSVGRTDLPGGSSRTLTTSLKKLVALSSSTTIYPGHGPESTIGLEKQTNFFMKSM